MAGWHALNASHRLILWLCHSVIDDLKNHWESGADISLLACLPMDDSCASDFDLMKIDNKGRVLSFSEKPKGNDLKAMLVDTTVLGLSKDEGEKKPYIAYMGVYIFMKEILLNLLRWRFPAANNFESEIIPASNSEFLCKVSWSMEFSFKCLEEHTHWWHSRYYESDCR